MKNNTIDKFELAHALINFGIEKGFPISNLRLNAFMFICQLYNYKINKFPLIAPNSFEAFHIGPVVRDVYVKYCLWGGLLIDKKEECNFILPVYLKEIIFPRIDLCPINITIEVKNKNGSWRKAHSKNKSTFFDETSIIDENLIIEESKKFKYFI